MATLEQLERALVNADKAGDAEAARRLAVAVKGARENSPSRIPDAQVPGTTPQAPDPTLGERAVGAGEAALTMGTGATTGQLGMVGGLLKGLAEQILSGQFGTAEAANMVEQSAMQGAEALTYAPRTAQGQSQVQAVGQALAPLAAVAPLAGEMAALARASRTAARAATDAGAAARSVAAPVVARAGEALRAAPQRIVQAVTGADEAPAAGTLASGGSAGTDMALQRRQLAQDLPVPIELTKGQATRDFEQLRFETETAKNPSQGAPLRDRQADTNQRVLQNFDALADMTGAEAANLIETGRIVVDKTLRPAVARSKSEYRARYREAEKAGELMEPVDLQPLADYLNQNRAGRTSAPILSTIADELNVQGVGAGALDDGSIAAGNATLAQAENLRKAVNRFVKDSDPNDLRVGREIKGVIDEITEGRGGELYQQARAARMRHAQLYENNAVVSNLLKTKRGTADRAVALEDVFSKTILNGSREDLSMLRRTLQVGGGEAGAQAWRELQGATARHIAEEATKGVATDTRGNPIVSAAKLNNAIRALDADGKLDFVFGKKGAQQMRDINDLAKVVYTQPPGTVNTSNTASVLLAAITEAGVTGGLTGLPVPIVSGLRALTVYAKDRKLRARINEALNEKPRQQSPNTKPLPAKTLH